MSEKHTPGPWSNIVADGYTVRHPQIYSDTGPVANATFLGECRIDELNSNARLIAAAPDLLDVLKELAALDFGAIVMNDDDERRIDFVARKARAAIDKAEGGAA